MGNPVLSSGDTNASMVPSRDRAKWLTLISSGTGMANFMRVVATGRRAIYQVSPATKASARAAPAQRKRRSFRVAAPAARAALADSVPENALNAKERSLADWNR